MERNLTHIALFAALIAVLGLIPKIDLASGVPITAQSLGIMLCGTVLGAKRGALAVLLFLALVAAGLPLLSGGRGGIGVFAGPSVGFLIGFPVAAFVAGWVMERTTLSPAVAATAGSVIGGIGVLYVFGIVGMSVMLDRMGQIRQSWSARSPRPPRWRVMGPATLAALEDADRVAEALRARGGAG